MPYKSVYVAAEQEVWENVRCGPANHARFSNDIAQAANGLEAEGYAVISVTPITRGSCTYDNLRGWGIGFGCTAGVTLLGKK